MACSKSALQPFVDWANTPQQGFFVHAVTVLLTEHPEGDFPVQLTGPLVYVPVRIVGVPPDPGHPGLRFSSYFQGNLVATSSHIQIRHILIELFDPIEIVLETIQEQHVTKVVSMQDISCSSSGAALVLQAKGSDGLSYTMELLKISLFQTPHQIGFRH